MARQGIGTGSSANDGTGDNLRVGAAKINDNFGELYTYFGDGTNLNFSGGVWNTVSAGINTLSSVGIGTTNPRFALEVGAVGASGTSLYVNGDARVTGILTVGSSSISLNGSTNEITVGTGITISGNTGIISATQVNIGGEILTGAGVTSLVAGSNITLSGSTGQVTINSSGGGGSAGAGGTWGNYDGNTGVTTTKKVKIQNNLEVTGVTTSTGGFVGNVTGNTSGTAGGLTGSPNITVGTVGCGNVTSTGSITGVTGSFSGNLSVGIGSTESTNTPTLTLSHNNPTVVGTAGTTGQVKQIGGQPYYYDGTTWRALFLVGAASTVNQADSDWDNTMIRMNFDQANIGAVTNLKDGRTPSVSQVDLVASPVKYGSKSARLQANNGGLKFTQDNSGSIYYPFEGAWTLEGWFYFDSSTLPNETNIIDSPILFANWHPNTSVSRNWKIGYYHVTGTLYNFYWYNRNSSDTGTNRAGNGSTGFMFQQLAAASFADNAWHHIAIVREPSNGSIHFYLDGTESGNTNADQLIDNQIYDIGSHSFVIGAYQLTGDSGSFEGNIDDIRVSKSARYTANFTPPSSALPITGSTTTVYEPANSKVGEISLGGSPAWTGTPGVTASQIAAGQYRATFATAYSNATDYVIQTSMNDYTPATTPVSIGVKRFTTHADFFVKRVSDGANIDTGSLAIDLFKK